MAVVVTASVVTVAAAVTTTVTATAVAAIAVVIVAAIAVATVVIAAVVAVTGATDRGSRADPAQEALVPGKKQTARPASFAGSGRLVTTYGAAGLGG